MLFFYVVFYLLQTEFTALPFSKAEYRPLPFNVNSLGHLREKRHCLALTFHQLVMCLYIMFVH